MNIIETLKTNKKKAIGLGTLAIIMAGAFSTMVALDWAPISWGWGGAYSNSNGVAIKGYDIVSYRVGQRPLKGKAEFKTKFASLEWHFASVENKTKFEAAPEKFAPEFGGFCSTGIRLGFTFPADPEVYTVHNDKLYLFADISPQTDFVNELPRSLSEATSNWQKR